jgi:DNA-binding HxlR family transcriptional regulator
MRGEQVRCGLDIALEVVGGKWKSLLLWELQQGPRRFSSLRRCMDSISEKMLAQQLRELEADGVVHRCQYNEVPPRVEYWLTAFGESLNAALEPLCRWGEHNAQAIEERRGYTYEACDRAKASPPGPTVAAKLQEVYTSVEGDSTGSPAPVGGPRCRGGRVAGR